MVWTTFLRSRKGFRFRQSSQYWGLIWGDNNRERFRGSTGSNIDAPKRGTEKGMEPQNGSNFGTPKMPSSDTQKQPPPRCPKSWGETMVWTTFWRPRKGCRFRQSSQYWGLIWGDKNRQRFRGSTGSNIDAPKRSTEKGMKPQNGSNFGIPKMSSSDAQKLSPPRCPKSWGGDYGVDNILEIHERVSFSAVITILGPHLGRQQQTAVPRLNRIQH